MNAFCDRFAGLVGLACLFVSTRVPTSSAQAPKPSPAPVSSAAPKSVVSDKDKAIAELQRQIDELNKKLTEIKSGGASAGVASTSASLSSAWVKSLVWRALGPANMGGRIVALAVVESDPSTFFVATGGGGLLKTTNNGTTFAHLFDQESTVAIGDVAVAPSNKEIVWVGTGENNPRNSVSYGDGVYKSVDGGKTWTNMGLKETFQIGKIVIHPTNPDIVYVGALGRLWGPNVDRGLYKTTDGGKSWAKVLFVDDKTGVIDMRMHPSDPETLVVATWERQRDLYDSNEPIKKHAPGSALYKTTDGGKTFRKLSKGLPTVNLGRIGLDYYRKNPNVLFAIIDTEKAGIGPPKPKGAPTTPPVYLGVVGNPNEAEVAKIAEITAGGPADKAGLQSGDVVLAVGEKSVARYRDLADMILTKKPGEKAKLKIKRGEKTIDIEVTFEVRPSQPLGRGSEGPLLVDPAREFATMLGGQRENSQARQGADGFQTGGVFKSTDGGESWARINSINPRPMYFSQVRVDPSDENYVYVLGVAYYRSTDGGKTFDVVGGRQVHADGHALWINPKDGRHMILGCDGGTYVSNDRMINWDHLNHVAIGQFYHVALDPRRPYKVYGGLQDNGSWGGPSYSRTGGAVNEDWISLGGGDGFKCQVDQTDPDQVYWTSQNGGLGRRNLRTGEVGSIRPMPEKGKTFRFNWNTPFLLSSHNSRIYYAAGNHVFRSLDRGNNLKTISPPISRTDTGTATAFGESPKNPDVLYVGTDDGLLWGTTDGGKTWVDLTPNVGLGGHRYVATIEPSRFEEGRVYVCFDGHRSNVDDPLIYVSEDFGKTWKSLRGNLPGGSTKCLREDIVNSGVLWLGTEFAVWASIDRGASWSKINGNLPTVAVLELAQHPTAGEIVAATHGRSLWVLDAVPIRQSTPEVLKEKAYLYRPQTAIRWRSEPNRGGTNRRFVGQNPPAGASIYVNVSQKPEKMGIKILDDTGATITELSVPRDPGLHRVNWSLFRSFVPPKPDPGSVPPAPPTGVIGNLVSGLRGAAGGGRRTVPALPGFYRVVLTVDGKEQTQILKIESDPAYPEVSEIVREDVATEANARVQDEKTEAIDE